MLALDSPRWRELMHAYGPANDTPQLIAELLRVAQEDVSVLHDWDAEPWERLTAALCHQGSVYPAAYATVPYLVALAASHAVPDQLNCLAMVGTIALGQHEANAPAIPPDIVADYTVAIERAGDLMLEALSYRWADTNDYRILLGGYATLRGQPELGRHILFG
jgi:hypothetical protein